MLIDTLDRLNVQSIIKQDFFMFDFIDIYEIYTLQILHAPLAS